MFKFSAVIGSPMSKCRIGEQFFFGMLYNSRTEPQIANTDFSNIHHVRPAIVSLVWITRIGVTLKKNFLSTKKYIINYIMGVLRGKSN